MDLEVGIAAWIIQDGNYDDFAPGASYRFALEFFFTSDLRLDDGTLRPQLGSLGGGEYEAHGRVIRCTPSYWVVDFGVPAYQNSPPPAWVHADALVAGRVYIGVDPFFYFERLKDELGMPDLFREWTVTRIELETTAWKETADSDGRRMRERDRTRTSFMDVPATDAWHHDGGHAHYVLHCSAR